MLKLGDRRPLYLGDVIAKFQHRLTVGRASSAVPRPLSVIVVTQGKTGRPEKAGLEGDVGRR